MVHVNLTRPLCGLFPGLIAGDSISPDEQEVSGKEGQSVTLRCSYDTSYENVDLYWYRHCPNQAPQFILYKGAGSLSGSHIPDTRYQSTTSTTSTELTITQLTLADTALYYYEDVVNRKKVHSINTQIAFDATFNILDVAKWPGSTRDPRILMGSGLRREAPCTSWVSCWVTVAVPARRLDTSQSTTGSKCNGEDRVIQTRQDVNATEGHTVSLGCTFETTDTNAYLFWYKQDINDFPRFILSHFMYGGGRNAAEFNKDRFDAQIQNTSVPLRIQNLQLSDSALYYCGDSYQQTVHSIQDRVQALQGDKVTLSCNYSSANYFFWYLQYPSSSPQFLIKEYTELSGFTLKKDKEMFHLEISSAVVTDSALYYCAVRPTIEGNSLDGTSVTLSYNFSRTAAGSDYFFWYRQYPGDPPQYLMYISGLGYIRTAESLGSDKRFSTKLTEDKTRCGSGDLLCCSDRLCSVLLCCEAHSDRKHRLTLIHSLISICCSSPDCKGEDRVIQTREDVIITEGHTVSLRCNFETTDTNAYLFWYKQDINDFPRFSHALRMEEDLMLQSSTKTDLMPKSKTSVPLRIQNLQLSDSALYYCGLKPTVTGNTDSLYKNLTAIQSRYEISAMDLNLHF
ncbi:T cell receptor alpha variable 3 [Merluccius polli]|nr:T cell receptor alpha variable 3 [Merluccius polli]